MKKRALIRIEVPAQPAGAPGVYTAKLFDIRENGPIELGQGPFIVTPELLNLKTVLPGDTPASGLDDAGLKLYRALYAALGQPLLDMLSGETTAIHFDLGDNDLRSLPWEILIWSDAAMGVSLTRVRAKHDISRVWQMKWDASQVSGEGPLRVLIAMGDTTGVAAQEELIEIRRRVQPNERAIDIDAKSFKNEDELYQAIKDYRPHVLHFIGHGESTRLKFAGWNWTAIDIGDVGGIALKGWKPSLVFLNACRSAVGQPAVSLGDLAPMCVAFLLNGAQAAVAMQGNIQGTAAGTLAGMFYEQLAAGSAIHEALSAARADVAAKFSEKEASYPALILRCSSEAALPCFRQLSADYRDRVKFCNILPVLDVFVNQVAPRREIYGSLWPYREDQRRDPFILLRGASSHGKTILAGWLLDLASRLGHVVRYVDVGIGPTLDFVTILELIWGGGPNVANRRSPLLDVLSLDAEIDWPAKFDAAKQAKDIAIYSDFRKALAKISAERPVTLVLDGIRKNIEKGSFWYLWENLFLHIGGELKNVNVVLALDDDNYQYYEVEGELAKRSHLRSHKLVGLRALQRTEFFTLWKEYLYFRNEQFRDPASAPVLERLTELIQNFQGQQKNAYSVGDLESETIKLAGLLPIALSTLPGAIGHGVP